jgi:hypothetical protein
MARSTVAINRKSDEASRNLPVPKFKLIEIDVRYSKWSDSNCARQPTLLLDQRLTREGAIKV